LAAKLRAKRRPLPLTSTTLAGQIGVEPDELDAALHGRAAGGLGGGWLKVLPPPGLMRCTVGVAPRRQDGMAL
jgi:hypothetical protein